MNATNKTKLTEWKNQQAAIAEAARITANRQRRIMRHLGREIDPAAARWEKLMALCGRINKEVAPMLAVRQEAESAFFQARKPAPVRVSPVVSGARPKPPMLTGYENSPEWWQAMELKEREDRKAGLIA